MEKNDISDILLPNIHIDVRVIFDDNQVFVPKSHFELGLTPDIYAVLKIDADFKYVEFLRYFKPSQIDKNNQNDEYYFFSKNKLSAPESLTRFIQNFPGKNPRKLTEEEFFHGRELVYNREYGSNIDLSDVRIFAKKYDIDKVIVVKKICERSITIIFR